MEKHVPGFQLQRNNYQPMDFSSPFFHALHILLRLFNLYKCVYVHCTFAAHVKLSLNMQSSFTSTPFCEWGFNLMHFGVIFMKEWGVACISTELMLLKYAGLLLYDYAREIVGVRRSLGIRLQGS